MRTRSTRPAPAVAVAMLLLLGACGDNGDEPTGLGDETAQPEATQTSADDAPTDDPAEDPTGDPTDAEDPTEPVEHVFPEAGVTIIEPVPANEAEAAALATYVEFAREWRRTLREVQLSDQLASLAVPDIIEDTQGSLDYQVENGIRYSGEMVITPVVERSSSDLVVLGGCVDASALTLIDDGEERPVDGIDEHPVIPMQVLIANAGGIWTVNENIFEEDQSC